MRAKRETSDEKTAAAAAAAAAPDKTRRAFVAWVESVGGSREAARLLGVSRSYVDMIRSGDRSPGLRTAYRIEQLTDEGIRMQAWVSERRGNG